MPQPPPATIPTTLVYRVLGQSEKEKAWSGTTPETCIQMLMHYLRCALQGAGVGCDTWFQQLPKGRFKPPFAHNSDESVKLFSLILAALYDTDRTVTRTQLHRFYDLALDATELPFILHHNHKDESWFVFPDASYVCRSVFLYSERLRTGVLSRGALYPMLQAENTNNDFGKQTQQASPVSHLRTLQRLGDIAALIEYIEKQGKFPCLPSQ